MLKLKRLLIPLVFVVTTGGFTAQQTLTVSGVVKSGDDNRPLQGVTITLNGSTIKAITNGNGFYQIHSVPVKGELKFSRDGYETSIVPVDDNSTVNITLSGTVSSIEQVVMIGYGSQKKKDLTGAISVLSDQDFSNNKAIQTFADALSGLAPGVTAANRNATPGSAPQVYIRGIGSISGDTDPLYVVDGFPTDATQAAAIDPNTIKSIDILKDASSTAIYGSRGANGVIIITTKSGKPGELQVNVNAVQGISTPDKSRFYHVMDGAQYVEWYKEAAMNNGTPIPSWVTNWNGTNTDWQSLSYRDAPYRNYGMSFTGGTDKATYLVSVGYLDQQDIRLNAGYKKLTANLKFDFKPTDKLSFGINVTPTYGYQKLSSPDDFFGALTSTAILLPPIIPAYNSDGTPSDPNSFGVLNAQFVNPLTLTKDYDNTIKSEFLLASMYGEWKILGGLSFRSAITGNLQNFKNTVWQPVPLQGSGVSPTTSLLLNSTQDYNWLSENTLTYDKQFGKHKINALIGYSVQSNNYENIEGDSSNFPSNLGQTLAFGQTRNTSSGKGGNSLLSAYGRLNYSFDDRYLVTATVRRDGSSRFGSDTRWGTFPSVAIAWNASNENFLKNVKAINQLKLRGSYGTTGSNFIGDFSSIGSMVTTNQSFGGQNVIGMLNGDPGNPSLSWEISKQIDGGFDLRMFNRFSLTFDYYHDITTSLLLNVNVPPSTGYSVNLQNIGKVKKWGYETSLNANIINNTDWSWNIGGNFTYADHKITKLGSDGSPVKEFFDVLESPVGGRLEEVHVLKQIGILTQRDIDNGVAHRPGDKPGDIKFFDANGDGTIDAFNGADGILMGDNIPKILYGITTSVRYKDFRLSATLNGQGGAHVLDFAYQLMTDYGNNTNLGLKFWNGRWVSAAEPGNGTTPRAGFNDAGGVSSYMIQSTNYMSINNITLDYKLPVLFEHILHVKDLHTFFSVQNVYMFTNFEGGNPLATSNFSNRVAGSGRLISLNVEPTSPLARTYSLGVNFSF